MDIQGLIKSLQERANDPSAGMSYAIDEGGGTFGLDAIMQDLSVDESRMCVTIPFADGNQRDGVGDLIEVEGIELSRHRANPIALYDHGKQVSLPIGQCQDPQTLAYTVHIDGPNRCANAPTFFYQGKGMGSVDKNREYDHALFCQQLFDLIAKRFVRGGSIGYTVLAAKELPPDFRTGTPKGLHLMAVKMLEASVVVLPANQDTVGKSSPQRYLQGMSEVAREVLSLPKVCGKSLSPVLVKSLTPFVTREARMAWDGKGYHRSGEAEQNRNLRRQRTDIGEERGPTGASLAKEEADVRANQNAADDAKRSRQPLPGDRDRAPGQVIDLSDYEDKGYVRADDADMNARRDDRSMSVPEHVQRIDKITADRQGNRNAVLDNRSRGTPMPGDEGPEHEIDLDTPPTKALTKRLKELRRKYTPVKSLRRRVKRSAAGAATLYIRRKDIARAEKDANSRGVQFSWVREAPHGFKVKAVGPDDGIDNIARSYGQSKYKSMPTSEGTMNRSNRDTMGPPDNGIAGPVQEPYGAQLLRRIHEDLSILLQDYDQLHGPLENAPIKKWLQKLMEAKTGHLDDIEKMFGTHYKELPGLGGGEDDDEGDEEDDGIDMFGEDDDEDEDIDTDDFDDEDDLEDDDDFDDDFDDEDDFEEDDDFDDEDQKDMGDLDNAAVGADSTPREETDPSDAFQASTKSLRAKYKHLAHRRKSGLCSCGTCSACRKSLEGETEDDDDLTGRDDQGGGTTDDEEEMSPLDFEPHEMEHLSGARDFLSSLSRPDSPFEEEDRMKAYHFHKLFEGMRGPIEDMVSEGEPTEADGYGLPGMKGAGDYRQKDVMGAVRKIGKEAARMLGFGDPDPAPQKKTPRQRAQERRARRAGRKPAARSVTDESGPATPVRPPTKVVEPVKRAAGTVKKAAAKVGQAATRAAVGTSERVAGAVNRVRRKKPGDRGHISGHDIMTAAPKVAQTVYDVVSSLPQ